MENQPTMALIVARPGPLRSSLISLASALPQIDIVAESRDMPSLLRMGAQLQPNLVLMETNLPGGHVHEALRYIHREWAATKTVVLVDDAAQQQEAELAGADVVLFKGFRAANLMEIIEELLPQAAPLQTALSATTQPVSQ